MRNILIALIIVMVSTTGLAVTWFSIAIDPKNVLSLEDISIESSGKEFRGPPGPGNTRLGRRLFITSNIWFYCYPPTGELILIEEGYRTDLGSIPKQAFLIGDQYSTQPEPAVVHDWLYAVGEEGKRKFADDVFLYAMKQYQVPFFQRAIFYAAVRFGGSSAYGRANEWNFGRPGNPWAEDMVPPKPTSAVVDVINCQTEFVETTTILREERGRFATEY